MVVAGILFGSFKSSLRDSRKLPTLAKANHFRGAVVSNPRFCKLFLSNLANGVFSNRDLRQIAFFPTVLSAHAPITDASYFSRFEKRRKHFGHVKAFSRMCF